MYARSTMNLLERVIKSTMRENLEIKIAPLGDKALRVEFGAGISPEINRKILSFSLLLEKVKIDGVIEWIPTYAAVTLFYDPYKISFNNLIERVLNLYTMLEEVENSQIEIIHIPTFYGGSFGPDLETVARYNELSVEEVIKIHTQNKYLIYMMGFTPGFPYLGGMSKKIAIPRLKTPRKKVLPGSIGIAGEQTGIYSLETPGGWQLIGRTPLRLYDSKRETPMLLQAGKFLKFVSISKEEYEYIEESIKLGTYQLKIEQEKTNKEDDVKKGGVKDAKR